jgi:hypothetical protein
MKKQSVNTIAKKLFFGSMIAAVLFLSFQNKVTASDRSKSAINTVTDKTEKVLVKYVGSNEEGALINVKYNNEKGENFRIVIKDQSGEELYAGTFDDKNFDRRFLFPKENEVNNIIISLKSASENSVQTYKVSIKTSMLQDVFVRKN